MGFVAKHSILTSFKYAIQGLATGIKNGRNFRIQVALGILAILFGIILRIDLTEWTIVIITIASVIILELINTAIESIVDMVSPEIQEKAKIAKDVAAASVLVAAIGSILIACFIFLPKLL